ncbi:RIP metalloprotease RseP [Alkaliphilus peptidifermentans]|uniref:Zinc metalloprotease n=1 Tax=Alkaliphilus peptidifermentans DSM 18978 TaxID=1120976 RepID=A0A1G5DDS3_9FIRM|nr:RIP metalloprotease RseP [Alkaliphilus peptidifermentans]SCY12766.1 regulator of sigma E protease [Alkaliphilus peptidifermentans DSM 18978]
MQTAIAAIAVFGLLVAFHELGHFCVAKAAGIKVHEFAIGMGPKLINYTRNETTYSLRVLPIGGYVRMEGEDEASNDARSFNNKPIPVRMAVLFAGSFMNFVLGILLFTILFYSVGAPTTTINGIIENTPAEMAGLLPGDQVRYIDGKEINNWQELVDAINDSQGDTIKVDVMRNGQMIEKNITPFLDEETGQIMIGIAPRFEKSFIKAFTNSFRNVAMIMREILGYLRGLLMRQATPAEVVGPVGIISLVGEAARAGWLNVVFLAALISVNLGIMNLLPIPALDGSRIIFLFVELLRGKPVDPEKEGMIHMIGFAILITLMIFVTYQDYMRLF